MPNWRKKLTGQEAPMDVDQFWDRLEPKLPPQRKRRALWWWLLPVSLLLAGGLFWWGSHRTGADDMGDSADRALIQEHSNGHDESTAGSRKPSMILPPGEEEVEGIMGSDDHLVQQSVDLRSPSGESGPDEKIAEPDRSRTKALSTDSPLQDDKWAGIFMELPVDTRSTPVVSAGETVGSPALGTGRTLDGIGTTRILPSLQIGLLSAGLPVLDDIVFNLASAKPTAPGWTWALTASGGPGMGIRTIQAVQDQDAGWIDARQQSEKGLESWQVRMMGEVVSPWGVYLEAGLQWTHQNERFDWSKDSVSWAWGPATGVLVDGQGGSQPWQDTAWSSYTLLREVRHYNRISTVELPIGLGFAHKMGAWSIHAGGGLMINLQQSFSGRSLLPQNWPGYWDDEAELTLKGQLGLGYYGQIRVGRALLSGLEVFVQPTWSAYSGDRQAGDRFSLHYAHVHLQTGIRWRLSNH